MLAIDRMEIDDVGANPIKLASAIVDQLPNQNISVPIREIAKALDIVEIREEELNGLEGALIAPEHKSNGLIVVRSTMGELRKRFTIAHELGHYVNPTHKIIGPDGFQCSPKNMLAADLQAKNRYIRQEAEANEFAAELLMPRAWVREFLKKRHSVDLNHVVDMSKHFQVSKEAAARKYLQYIDEPAALIFYSASKIRYCISNNDFPRLNVWNRHPLPTTSQACRLLGQRAVSSWEEVLEDVWIDGQINGELFEQTLSQKNGFGITLIMIENLDEPEVILDEPRFK